MLAPPSALTPAPAAGRPAANGFIALTPWAPVYIARGSCLRLGSKHSRCQLCVAACPAQSLVAGMQSLTLGADCTGCGRCQAACPTAALQVSGFDALDSVRDAATTTLTVDCLRASTSESRGPMLRVPCLGGLSVGDWLALCADTGGSPVVGLNRGWCASCPSGGGDHPAQAALAQAATLMSEAGVPDDALPRLQAAAVAKCGANADTAAPATDPMVGAGRARRGFLAAFSPPVQATAARAARPHPAAARRRVLAALRTLAARHGGRLPAHLFHRLRIGADCQNHRVCAAACPTGALVRFRDDGAGRLGIAFDAANCVGCGHCVAVCPEQALRLEPGQGVVDDGLQPLTSTGLRECRQCGARFAAPRAAAHELCGPCRKSVDLAGAAFQTLFGARP